MPYIKKQYRQFAETLINQLMFSRPGLLNFVVTKVCHRYIKQVGLCYATLNEVIGVLECAKQELYRQVAAPYEDVKKAENGSVSDLDREN